MDAWNNFFLGELGAAAALSGLLFVSLSVNQARILALGRTADRGLEALGMLFLTLVVTSLALVPSQSLHLLGGEILLVALVTLCVVASLQRSYLRDLDTELSRRSTVQVWVNRTAVVVIALAGLALMWSGDVRGVYILPLGILLTFVAVAASAWVLLIEINR
jgi:hypothetical protein